MSRVNLGRVTMMPKGVWNSSSTYKRLDIVTNNGVSYIALQDVPANTVVTNTTYWMMVTPNFSIGEVSTLNPSESASASITSTSTGELNLNLGIPRGISGNETIDDGAGLGDIDVVWSANKTKTEVDTKAPAITETANGSLVTIQDGAENMPMVGLTVGIEPVQEGEGEPSPDNVKPITGWTGVTVTRTGKNLLRNINNNTVVKDNVTFTKNTDGSITITGTTSSSGNTFYNIDYVSSVNSSVDDLTKLRGKTVTYSVSKTIITGLNIYFGCFNENGQNKVCGELIGTFGTVTIPDYAYKGRVYLQLSPNTTFNNVTVYPQIELGSIATDYEPYSGQTVEVAFPSEAGTVYGGSLDVINGLLTVTKVWADLATVSTWYTRTNTHDNGIYIFTKGATSIFGYSVKAAWGSSYEAISSFSNKSSSVAYLGTGIGFGISNDGILYVSTNSATTVNEFKTFLSTANWQICAELATPLTYQLTLQQLTTLLGTNNIWADTGDTSVEYRADTKLYIQCLTKPTENDMVANANIDSRKFFMVGNSLYLSTIDISAGETIIIGTNCTAISLADALNQLNQ